MTGPKQYFSIKVEPRRVSNGGNVIEVGLRNETTDLLDRLFKQGFLKALWEPQSAARRRYDNGLAMQALYLFFKGGGKEQAATGEEYRFPVTLEGHVGTEVDIAETVYFRTLHLLGRHSQTVRCVCIDGWLLGMRDTSLRKALDELPKAMEQARHDVLKSLGRV